MGDGLSDEQKEDWERLVNKCHTKQAIWWLNGFWNELEGEADHFWFMVHAMIEIECGKEKRYGKLKWEEKEGSDLDQFQAHRFLEKMGVTMTVKELRAKVKNLDVDRNKRLALSEYLADKYSKTVQQIVEAPQGGQAAQEALDRAREKVESATQKMNESADAAEAAAAALAEVQAAREKAEAAKKEVEEAVQAVEAQEAARNKKIEKLQKKIANADGRLSQMKVNTAKNELAQVEGEDPLPLRKAKLTQKAALKKQSKMLKMVKKEEKKSTKAKEAADTAATAAQEALVEAKDALRELKEKGDGIAHGNIWWMEKELEEREKFMPKKKKKKVSKVTFQSESNK